MMSRLRPVIGMVTLLVCAVPAHADNDDPSLAFTWNTVSLLLTCIDTEAEFSLSGGNAFTLRAFSTIGAISDGDRRNWSPLGVGLGYRRYQTADRQGRFYGAGGTVVASGTKIDVYEGLHIFAGPKVEAGYTWRLDRMTVFIFGEIHLYLASTSEYSPAQGLAHVLPGEGLGVGVGLRIGPHVVLAGGRGR